MSFIPSESLGGPRGLGAPRESGLWLVGWAPTDSQVGVALGRPCPQPQLGENTESGPALGAQFWETEGSQVWLSGPHFREDKEIWPLPLVSSI